MRGERRGRGSSDPHLIHRGRSRRLSLSPVARITGGERGPSRVPLYGGDRGGWSVVRPRRRKVFEQADGQRDSFRAIQRRGRGWDRQQRRQSGSRFLQVSERRFSDMEDSSQEASVQSYDRRAFLQYTKPGRSRQEARWQPPSESGYNRRVGSRGRHNRQSARPGVQRRRSTLREPLQQLYARAAWETEGVHGRGQNQPPWKRDLMVHDNNGMAQPSFVSFYFTNVPADISYISLRRGFEVCGMMEDVYLARKRNVNGGVFGFVRYGNVKDVDKLLKAVNNVWFGDWRVVAKVATFDRYGSRKQGVGAGVHSQPLVLDREGVKTQVGRGIHIESNTIKGNERVVGTTDIGRGKVEAAQGNIVKVGKVEPVIAVRQVQRVEDNTSKVFVPKYTSAASDMSWASKGMVASVLNGDVIPMLQRRIFDAGFAKLVIIPLGADKVFLRSLDDEDVGPMLSEAADFFNQIFSTPVRWNKNTGVHERGAWLRIYGVPLHAWNYDFFKLCVYDCGRLLRVDDVTVDRDRFDYARVLVSTSSLDIIKTEAHVVVNGVLLDFQLIEEWGYAVGEDACLLEDVESQVDDRTDMPTDIDNGIGGEDVDDLLNSLSKDWQKEEEEQHLPSSPAHPMEKASPASLTPVASPTMELPASESATSPQQARPLASGGNVDPQFRNASIDDKIVVKRASSCPPGRDASGPWSLEWVKSHKSVSMGAPFKPKHKVASRSSGVQRGTKKKGGGYLRHCALNLKRIARLSDKDRREVLRALRRTSNHRKAGRGESKAKATWKEASSNGTSQTSVNNDWTNWLVLHGNDKVLTDDVCEIGRTVGLNFGGDQYNKFDVLSGVGRKNREGGGDGV